MSDQQTDFVEYLELHEALLMAPEVVLNKTMMAKDSHQRSWLFSAYLWLDAQPMN